MVSNVLGWGAELLDLRALHGRQHNMYSAKGCGDLVSTVLPIPLTESSSQRTSMADILGLITLIVTVPAVLVAVIVLVRYFRQRSRTGQAHQRKPRFPTCRISLLTVTRRRATYFGWTTVSGVRQFVYLERLMAPRLGGAVKS
jgi:hypothetical protein